MMQYSAEDLRSFKTVISNKIEEATDELKYLKNVMADRAKGLRIEGFEETSASEIEALVTRQTDFIESLNQASYRIKNKTFGIDTNTGELMPKEILLKQPFLTTLSIPAGNEIVIEPRKCRICGCTDEDCSQCVEKTGIACHWIAEDLCSACEDEAMQQSELQHETKATPTEPAKPLIEPAENPTEPVIKSNDNDMNFFQQLSIACAGRTDLTMRIMQKNNKLTLNIMPGSGSSSIKPIIVTGLPGDIDAEFFKTIAPGVSEISGIVTNIAEVKKEAQSKASAEIKKSDTAAKSQPDKKPEKKTVKKEAPKKEKKLPADEPDLFGNEEVENEKEPVAETEE